jgi:anti-anti-sigma factor
MSITVRKRGNKRTVKLSGDVTIFEISEMWQKLDPVLRETDEIDIDLGGVSDIDTAGLQLLMVAKKAEQESAKSVHLLNHSEAVIDALEVFDLAGYFGDPLVLESADKGDKS